MICSKCKQPMVSAEAGKVFVCLTCGKSVDLPLAGPTVAHSAASRVQKQERVERQPSEGEVTFAEVWRELYPTLPFVTEYFVSVVRNWKTDFAWPEVKVSVEWEGYGHQKDNRYKSDLDKYNFMAYDGWALFRGTKGIFRVDDGARFCRMVAETIRRRERGTYVSPPPYAAPAGD